MFAKLNKAYASKEVSAITYMYVDPDRLGLILIQTLFVQFINAFLKLPTEKYRNPASKITQIRSYDLFSGVPIGRGDQDVSKPRTHRYNTKCLAMENNVLKSVEQKKNTR